MVKLQDKTKAKSERRRSSSTLQFIETTHHCCTRTVQWSSQPHNTCDLHVAERHHAGGKNEKHCHQEDEVGVALPVSAVSGRLALALNLRLRRVRRRTALFRVDVED